MTGGPVFWGEGHMPEHRIGQRELDSHVGAMAGALVNVRDNTFKRSFCLDVRQIEP